MDDGVLDWRSLVAAVCWTTAGSLAIWRLASDHAEVTVCVVLIGQLAMVLTGWQIVEHVITKAKAETVDEIASVVADLEEQTVERVARRLTAALRESREPSRVTSLR